MSSELMWFKSSYSSSGGGECLEVAHTWRRPTHSDDQGGSCLEVAPCPHTIRVRDSKLGARSPQLAVPAGAWTAFVANARSV